MVEIYVDADACPVKDETVQVAARHSLKIYLVSDGGIRPPPNPLAELVIVDQGPEHRGQREGRTRADSGSFL